MAPFNKVPFTPIQQSNKSDDKPSTVGKTMPSPRIVKTSRAAGALRKKIAKGLASLYDDEPAENEALQSPILTHGPIVASKAINPASYIPTPNAADGDTDNSEGTMCAGEPSSDDMELDDSMDINESGSEVSEDLDLPEDTKIRSEWVGTSQFFIQENTDWQKSGQFYSIRQYLTATQAQLSQNPYDPSCHIDVSRICTKIGFADIGVAHAYRALLLVEGFQRQDPLIYPHVRDMLIQKCGSQSEMILQDEKDHCHVEAYRQLLNGMLDCGCFWDGVLVAKKALKLFPGDSDLLEIREWLADGFKDRCEGLRKLGAPPEEAVTRSRVGKLYQKAYPWTDKELFKRKPALVRAVNVNFGAGNCEVRPVIFRPPSSRPKFLENQTEKEDVGPLGIFAARDIEDGETVLVDQGHSVISDVPSSKLQHCDCCHASLRIPFLHPSDIFRPACCKSVAFCSRKCAKLATAPNGYHRVLCGHDFDWLYENPNLMAGTGQKWPSVMFLRVIAIVLADRNLEIKAGKKPTHALQHQLLARMTANYAPSSKLHPEELQDWSYESIIVAPVKILQTLGINIFSDPDFTQDVIQTIFWRLCNNASMSICDLFSPRTSRDAPEPTKKSPTAVQMICLNPSYLFFNHSCSPNISWHGAVPDPWVDIEWITGYDGKIMNVGSSAVFCRAGRDIKKGEQLFISYVGDPMEGERDVKRASLKKWFEGGCGCDLCVEENKRDEMRRKSIASSSSAESIRDEKLVDLL